MNKRKVESLEGIIDNHGDCDRVIKDCGSCPIYKECGDFQYWSTLTEEEKLKMTEELAVDKLTWLQKLNEILDD